ncbi:MAG: SDR family NAD(P)-dependent oxidoreductase, partial [Candidatus Puniceispirillaceae bacterium]
MGEAQKTIMLTGASRGIGHATVKRFSDAGWRVITCSRGAVPGQCPWHAEDGDQDHIEVNLESPEEIERGAAELMRRLDGQPLHALV